MGRMFLWLCLWSGALSLLLDGLGRGGWIRVLLVGGLGCRSWLVDCLAPLVLTVLLRCLMGLLLVCIMVSGVYLGSVNGLMRCVRRTCVRFVVLLRGWRRRVGILMLRWMNWLLGLRWDRLRC